LSDWLLAASLLLLLFMAWRAIVVVQRYHRTDYGNRWLNWLEGLNRLFCLKFHRLVHDPFELPASGPALVVANHLSGLDALLLIAISNRPLRFMIAREHYNWPGLTWWIVRGVRKRRCVMPSLHSSRVRSWRSSPTAEFTCPTIRHDASREAPPGSRPGPVVLSTPRSSRGLWERAISCRRW
jgi:hypothetical protein